MKVSVPSLVPSSSSIIGDKTELTYPDYKCSIYETSHGIEWDIVLETITATNTYSLKVDSTLEWYYQPSLTDEYLQEDCEVWTPTYVRLKNGQEFSRPENVTGSYAVYGLGWGNIYKTGKYMHVYRPRVYDLRGEWVWGELSYMDGVLTVTVDQNWLTSKDRVYPIIIDPSFGYDTQGGSSTGFGQAAVFASNHVLGVNADVTQIGMYCTDSTAANAKAAIYDHEVGDDTPENLDGTTSETNVGAVAWYIFDFNPDITEASDEYWLAGFASDADFDIYYDSGGDSEWYAKAYNGFDDPWTDVGSNAGTFQWSIYANYTVAGGNNAPINDAATITNMDDGDNLYAQLRNYLIDYDAHDPDGYQDIDRVAVNITQGALTRCVLEFDNATDTFSITAGDNEFDIVAGSCSYSRAGNNLNLTFAFRVEWDATAEADVELKATIWDDEPSSDSDTLQTDYADVVTDLVTTFSLDDDRGNLAQSITASGAVTYTGSANYPPDAEFTSVSVYDSANNNEGTDNTIVNGAWSIAFNAPGTVGTDTYNLYIDMADADYVDGEEAPSDTFITDRIMVYWEQLNDTRQSINAPIEGRYRAVLDYDESPLGAGDSLGSSFGALAWDAGNTWFDLSHSEAAVGDYQIGVWTGTEATFTVTSIAENITETDYRYDRGTLLTLDCNSTTPAVGQNVLIWATGQLEYDGHTVAAGDALNLTDGVNTYFMVYNGTRWTTLHAEGIAVVRTINNYDVFNEATHNINDLHLNFTLSITWGTPGVLLIYVTDGTAGINGAFIGIWNGLGALIQSGETNATGYYDAGAVAVDNYTIEATEPGYGSEMNTTLVTIPQIVTVTLTAAAGAGGSWFNLFMVLAGVIGTVLIVGGKRR